MKLLVLRCWWLAFVLFAACFSPQFQDGEITCGPNGECPPGLDCFGGVCRASDPGPDAATGFPLTVVLGGNMMGTVTSSPAGIDCGATCTETFDAGTMVTLTATPMSGSVFVGWSGACSGTGACTLSVATAVTVTANFAVDNSLVVVVDGDGSGVVSSSPAGINCGIDCMEQFPADTMVVLTASPATGSQFDGWSGGGCTGTGTCMVTADVAKMVTATFSLTQHALTVIPDGNGTGSVASTPAGIDCGVDCSESFPYNTMVTLTATADTGSMFAGWTGGGCTGTAPCQATITQATSVTATFTLTTHALMVTKAGNGTGTVTSAPAGIACGIDCMESYDYGTMVTLSATPAAGSTFTGWSGGGCSGTAPCTVDMTQAANVAATFTLDVYTLIVSKLGNGSGTVSSTTAGIDCGADCSEPYNYGTMITLTAAATTGSTFTGWGGECSGTTSTCTVTVAAATNVTATFALDQHALTVSKLGGGDGTITGAGINCDLNNTDCGETYDYNTVVTLNASPATGSSFTGWGGECSGTGQCQVTMTQARSVTAEFALTTHVVTVTKSGTGVGTVTSTPTGISCGADCSETYTYDTVVTLTATPDAGSTFGGWSGGGCTGTVPTCQVTVQTATSVIATFTVTSHLLTVNRTGNGTVSANVGALSCGLDCTETYTYGTIVTLTAVADPGWSFTGWTGGGCTGNGTCVVTMDQAKTVDATFTLGTAALAVTKDGSGAGSVTSDIAGINCGIDCNEDYPNNTTVVLTATPAAGSVFSGWSGGGCSGTSTCTVMTSGTAINVTATFTITVHTLSVSMAGGGAGTVTSVDGGIDCGLDCNEPYDYGTTVTLTAAPALNSTFNGWSGGGCTGTGNCVVTVEAATSVIATFEPVPYDLTVKPSGTGFGTVTSTPAGIDCGVDCDEAFNAGAMVTLTAVADPGSTFVGWTGDCTGTSTMCTVTMTGDLAVFPEFAVVQHQLTVTRDPTAGGDVYSINDATIDCGADCTESYSYNTVVPLKPSAAPGYTFTGWSGACTGNGDCAVTMDADKTVTANFVLTTYALNVNLAGNGSGTVSSMPAGISCSPAPASDCSEVYNENTVVTLTAAPATGTNFGGWVGCTSVSGTTCSVTMSAAKSVTATFNIQTFSLSVTKSGSGNGAVTSTPTGINCGADCNHVYNYGTNVQLTPSPAAGSTFSSWSGCTSISGTTCNVSMTAARAVNAVFTAIPPNYVFVTSTTHTGKLGGLAGADMICQARADAVSLPGKYRAWLSTSTVDAASRLDTARGWVRPDERPFADQVSDITSGRLFYPPRLDEFGKDVGAAVTIWTGTSGSGKFTGSACSDWSDSTSVFSGGTGVSDANGSTFTSFGGSSCAGTFRLLCFGIDNMAVASPPPVNARRAFTTGTTWNPSLGIANADMVCQSEADVAKLPGTYKALLATTTASALSRFSTAAATLPWARPDHTLVATTAAGITAPLLAAAPNRNAAGTTSYANSCVWNGAADLTSVGTAATTCNGWSSSAAADRARAGNTGRTPVATWFGSSTPTCNSTCRLYCLQE